MAGIGLTDVTPFLTVKPCVETFKSHLSKAVVDSGLEPILGPLRTRTRRARLTTVSA
jgi:hypothetical protein